MDLAVSGAEAAIICDAIVRKKNNEPLMVLTEGSNLPLPGKLPTFLGGTCQFYSQKSQF